MGLRQASEGLQVGRMKFNEPLPLPHIRDARVIRRFMCLISQEKGLWKWIGAKDRKGYGRFRYGQHTVAAHRVAYAIFNGAIPEGYYVHHAGENPQAFDVNPQHLVLVTLDENTYHSNQRRSPMVDDIPF